MWSLSLNTSYQPLRSHYVYHHVFVFWRSRFWSWERDSLLLSARLHPEVTAVLENRNYLFIVLLCSFWDFHRGGVDKFLFVLNDVASLGWRFQTFRKHHSFPKHQVTFTDKHSFLSQANGLFNYYILQPPLFYLHSAISKKKMEIFVNKLRIWIRRLGVRAS